MEVVVFGMIKLYYGTNYNNIMNNSSQVLVVRTDEFCEWIQESSKHFTIAEEIVGIIYDYLRNINYQGLQSNMESLIRIKQQLENQLREECVTAGYEPLIANVVEKRGYRLSMNDYKTLRDLEELWVS
jgi:hypothetical protein